MKDNRLHCVKRFLSCAATAIYYLLTPRKYENISFQFCFYGQDKDISVI